MPNTFFTIVARNYLSLALTLGDSVRRHHPHDEFRIFVADGTAGLPRSSYTHELIDLAAYLGEDLDEMSFQYNVTEFCTAVKPLLFRRLFASGTSDIVYYLDPDTVVFAPLDPVVEANPSASIYLAPHLLHCRLEDDHAYPEYKHLWEGIFNLGFCALRRSAATARFLEWWDLRLRKYCYADHFDGLHTDQKWVDYALVYFRSAVEVVAHEGLNVAHWNLDERPLVQDGDRRAVNGSPLLLFHFSGFDFRGDLLSRHVSPGSQARYLTPAVKQLARWYRAAVFENGYEEHIRVPYRFNFYDSGAAIPSLHRRLYRAAGGARRYRDPFRSDGAFYRDVESARLVDRSRAATGDYAASTLPGIGRIERTAHSLLRAFLRLGGARRYGYLLKFFNRYARLENHAFLLPAAGRPTAGSQRNTTAHPVEILPR